VNVSLPIVMRREESIAAEGCLWTSQEILHTPKFIFILVATTCVASVREVWTFNSYVNEIFGKSQRLSMNSVA